MPSTNWYEMFVDDVCAGKTNETPVSYRRKLRVLQNWIGERDVTALSPDDLRAFAKHLLTRKRKRRGALEVEGKLSPWTVRSTCVTVKHFLKWMYERGHMPDIASRWVVPQPPPPDPKAINQQTIDRMLSAAARMGEPWERVRNLALLYCLRDTGGRIGSLLSASVNNLDLQAGEMVTQSKGRTGTLYINPPTILTLRAWLDVRRERLPKSDALFTARHGSTLSRSGVYWILKRLAAIANVDGRFNPHAWRHAFVRDVLKSRKADLSQASRLLWHTSIRVTAEYYARWDDGELKAIHRAASPGMALPDPKLYGE